MCKGFNCLMRRNSHISLQGSWTGINSSCDLKCGLYQWIFIRWRSPASCFHNFLVLSFTLIDVLAFAYWAMGRIKDKFLSNTFPSWEPALQWGKWVEKFCSKRQFDQFISNLRKYPHMLRPPYYLSQFNHWSQAESDLKVLRSFLSFHFIPAFKAKLCYSA